LPDIGTAFALAQVKYVVVGELHFLPLAASPEIDDAFKIEGRTVPTCLVFIVTIHYISFD
jgi:hypothetical protein